MGRRLVVVGLQRQAELLLVAVEARTSGIPRPQGRLRDPLPAKTFGPRAESFGMGFFRCNTTL